MVIEYLQQIKDSYFEQKHALEKQLNLLEIQLKENTGMIKMLEETNDSCYELFTPRNVNSKNKAKINELMEEQKSIFAFGLQVQKVHITSLIRRYLILKILYM